MDSNKNKSVHGKKGHESLLNLLNLCKKNNFIKSIIDNYRVGYAGYNDKQFLATCLIEFYNGNIWILYSTTSFRSDRIKGFQWDAYNIKKINKNITGCFLVYPDTATKDLPAFKDYSSRYTSKKEYSAIDNILSHANLYLIIEQEALSSCITGAKLDAKGKTYEKYVADVLSNKDNLYILNNVDKNATGLNFNLFWTILSNININPSTITNITATTNIPKLPSGGYSKTDVYVEISTTNSNNLNFGISCKRTNKKSVTVHQYKASKFADVLDPDNNKLRQLLNKFQTVGSLKEFGDKNVNDLTTEIGRYNEKLTLWALGGIGGDGDATIQWARYLLIYDDQTKDVSFHSIEDYYNLLRFNANYLHFGTFFSWTYASKQKGKSIQLKAKIIK